MFNPPCCPWPTCAAHFNPAPGFCISNGSYQPMCRSEPVPRFRCKYCRRTFSRQTFRADYYDKKPHLNPEVYSRLASGCGLRQTARELQILLRNLQLKFRKICRHLRHFHRTAMDKLTGRLHLQFDELETFEGCRVTRPLTLALMIEADTLCWVSARAAPIPPRMRSNPRRAERIAWAESKHGRRPNRSTEVCRRTMAVTAKRCREAEHVELRTDKKSTYPGIVRQAFGKDRVDHLQFSSKIKRDTSCPLARINLAAALSRDHLGRMHRKSWLFTKDSHFLNQHLQLVICYRNYERPRFNRDKESPAQMLGLFERRLSKDEILGFRQDWGQRSVHPLSLAGISHERYVSNSAA